MSDKESKKIWWTSLRIPPVDTVSILMGIITVLLAIVIGTIIFQYLSLGNFAQNQKEQITEKMEEARVELEAFTKDQKGQIMEKMEEARVELEAFIGEKTKEVREGLRTLYSFVYSEMIKRHTQKLAGDDLGQKTVAIWVLLDVLNEIKDLSPDYPDLFDRIVSECIGAIPYLKLDIAKEEFKDSYRGKVWIWVILLESKNEDIINAIRDEVKEEEEVLTPKLLDEIFEYNKIHLPEETRKEFRESIDRLKPWIRSFKSEIQG